MGLDISLSIVKCEHCGYSEEVFSACVTHNLNLMAEEAGIYGTIWRPEENGITYAWELIQPLRKAIKEMKDEPLRFIKHNPENGWGSYDSFIPWLEKYLAACEKHPGAKVNASR